MNYINTLLTIRSEMLPFSENNQNINIFGVPPNTLPYMYMCRLYIVHNDNLPLGNIALHYMYVIQNNIAEDLMVFSDDFLHFLNIKKKCLEFTKTILWL